MNERDRQIIELYADNSLREVGVILDINFETVRRVLKRYGIARRPAHKNIHPHSGHTRGMKITRRVANLIHRAESIRDTI